MKLWVVLGVLAFRVLNALLIRTFFQADEYWQALEPAYLAVYGNGYLTWEWHQQIRSFAHPLIYTIPYKLCEALSLGHVWVLVLPKLVSALLACGGELGVWVWVRNWTHNDQLAGLTLAASLASAFNWFCITRSFSNTLELALTAWGLAFWPVDATLSPKAKVSRSFALSLGFACFSCLIRPTNAVIWLVLGLRLLWTQPYRLGIVIQVIAVGTVCVLANSVIDYIYYGHLVFPLLKFIQFNVVQGLSAFYGVNTWHFYIVQGVPILLLGLLPYTLHGLFIQREITDLALRHKIQLLIHVAIVYLAVFSLIQHKEFRFLYPLKPVFLLLAAISMLRLAARGFFKLAVFATLALNATLGFYFTRVHESGVIEVVQVLRDAALSGPHTSIGFLTPCHSTPFKSHFDLAESQANIWFLTCEPPIQHQHEPGFKLAEYEDESDEFYADPEGFMRANMPDIRTGKAPQSAKYPHEWPEYLVFFEALEKTMDGYLQGEKYAPYARLFNSRFHWDDRRTGDVIIYKSKPPT